MKKGQKRKQLRHESDSGPVLEQLSNNLKKINQVDEAKWNEEEEEEKFQYDNLVIRGKDTCKCVTLKTALMVRGPKPDQPKMVCRRCTRALTVEEGNMRVALCLEVTQAEQKQLICPRMLLDLRTVLILYFRVFGMTQRKPIPSRYRDVIDPANRYEFKHSLDLAIVPEIPSRYRDIIDPANRYEFKHSLDLAIVPQFIRQHNFAYANVSFAHMNASDQLAALNTALRTVTRMTTNPPVDVVINAEERMRLRTMLEVLRTAKTDEIAVSDMRCSPSGTVRFRRFYHSVNTPWMNDDPTLYWAEQRGLDVKSNDRLYIIQWLNNDCYSFASANLTTGSVCQMNGDVSQVIRALSFAGTEADIDKDSWIKQHLRTTCMLNQTPGYASRLKERRAASAAVQSD